LADGARFIDVGGPCLGRFTESQQDLIADMITAPSFYA
jgi:hypothetical protein